MQASPFENKKEEYHLNKSVNCEEFLRNIRVKQPQRSIYKEQKTASEE